MPLQATSGAASYDAFGGGVPVVPNYIEDVFSTWLYTGTGSSQTITNGIDLSTKGGLVWIKQRNESFNNILTDTARGVSKFLYSDQTNSQETYAGYGVTSFNNNGFAVTDATFYGVNKSAATYVSWTFRKQPKFFDVVTWTGDGNYGRTVAHALGAVPGCIIVKRTDTTSDWAVYHRGLTAPAAERWLKLNLTVAQSASSAPWADTAPSSTVFTVSASATVNASGGTYVAYLFAHDAGGFGLTGTDNVISCGSYTGNGSTTGPVVTLGYEPQWLMIKNASAATDWVILDTMRGLVVGGTDRELNPNQSGAESGAVYITPTATGFELNTTNGAYNASGNTFIYIAIRRGPMAVPTSGTSVFAPITATASTGTSRTVGFPADMTLSTVRTISDQRLIVDRLRGYANTSSATPSALDTTSTAAEAASSATVYNVWNTTALDGPYSNTYSTVWWHFRRAPSFFDEVCYTGLRAINNTTPQVVSHNLGVAPELVIFKCRSAATISFTATNWATSTILGGVYSNAGYLNTNDSFGFSSNLNPADGGGVSASSITIGYGAAETNATGNTYVAYLFATCAGVSKVGSYTGNGSTQTIDCGFGAGGARFVLIKRTDSTGGWYVYDTARGMTTLTDPYLLLNDTAAETATLGSVTTVSTGFALNSTILAAINISGGTYIFLAIA